tara:strand:- start:58 stop:993 length:936 start_codon:yes stop_codon:yes gene_type:complete
MMMNLFLFRISGELKMLFYAIVAVFSLASLPVHTQLVAATLQQRAATETEIALPWSGTTVQHLHQEYGRIFKYGNRNAASHRWATFLLDRAPQMSAARLVDMFSGFCAVSGSPVRPGGYNRYRLTLPVAQRSRPEHCPAATTGAIVPAVPRTQRGDMHYCCWPCVCDTQDFIRVSNRTVRTRDGERTFSFAVIGNPCEHEAALHEPFTQPFDGRRTTLARDAPEVRCTADGKLEGATLADSGHPIIAMFFPPVGEASDEQMFAEMCSSRAAAGYNSGMGEIFRKVAAIAPVKTDAASCDGDDGSVAAPLSL